jgi:hypothetical protein
MKTILPLAVVAAVAALASAGQYRVAFDRYTGYSDPRDPLAGLSMTIDADEASGIIDVTFSLDADRGLGTVKTIWFEESLGLGDAGAVSETGRVYMRPGRGSGRPAGARALRWEGTDTRISRKGRAANGIDAGESLTIRFDAGDDFFETGLSDLLAGEARIAFHLQRLGHHACESAHFVSTGGTPLLTAVPLPSAGLLAGAGLGLVAGRRRSR